MTTPLRIPALNFVQEARQCAIQMLANASYIEAELPNVELPDDLRAMTAQLCTTLVGTKHDVISELHEMFDADSPMAAATVRLRAQRLVRWLAEDIRALDELVTALRAASTRDERYGLAELLVTESAATILVAFNRMAAEADRLTGH